MSARLATTAKKTFSALGNRNYRLFFAGQVVSVSGTWMQSVGQAWLVLKLTNSGAAVGLILALQTLPILFGGAWGGLVADRYDKRRILLITQVSAAVLALTLGVLTLSGVVTVWMVGLLALGLGCVNVVDLPTRQAFVLEMVGRDHLTNAITLNSVVMNAARVVGPALAGLLIATVGIAACFLINAASFLAVIAGLAAMRTAELLPAQPAGRARGQLVEGLKYIWATPVLRTPLLMMAVIGTFAYEFTVSLPLLSRFTFHAGAQGFGLLSSMMGAGAVVGGLTTASRGRPSGRRMVAGAGAFGVLILGAAAAPTFAIEMPVMALVGAASIFFAANANSTIQLACAPEMRGRVMALYAVAFLGSTPIGGPIVGWVGQTVNPRASLALGGIATILAAAVAWRTLVRRPPRPVELAIPLQLPLGKTI
ncbi:MAG: MFS transporter [Candidatus Dormibacteria bacterium]